jgi:hypothetical protein
MIGKGKVGFWKWVFGKRIILLDILCIDILLGILCIDILLGILCILLFNIYRWHTNT